MNSIKEIKKAFVVDEIDNTKLQEFKGLMDPANVLMIVPKRVNVKTSMLGEGFTEYQKIPKIDQTGYQYCRFSIEYLKTILKILTATKELEDCESMTIGLKDGNPLIMEHKYFGLILAPRWNDTVDSWDDREIFKDTPKEVKNEQSK